MAGSSEFKWAKSLHSSCKIKQSSVPVIVYEAGRPRDRKVTIQNLSSNAFLFYIPSAALRRKVLQHELWRVGDSPFFVTEWKASFSLDSPSLHRAPIWAKIHNLVTDEGMSFIAKPLGVVVDVKPFLSFNSTEIKVIADLTQKLPDSMEIEREDGEVVILSISYPWLPPFCSICEEIGHKEALCPKGADVRIGKVKESLKNASVSTQCWVKKSQSPNVPAVPTSKEDVSLDGSVLKAQDGVQSVVVQSGDSVQDGQSAADQSVDYTQDTQMVVVQSGAPVQDVQSVVVQSGDPKQDSQLVVYQSGGSVQEVKSVVVQSSVPKQDSQLVVVQSGNSVKDVQSVVVQSGGSVQDVGFATPMDPVGEASTAYVNVVKEASSKPLSSAPTVRLGSDST
ncbi:hypothetical protein EUTSA_v10002893mg, partial [Eutrema salsugineum]